MNDLIRNFVSSIHKYETKIAMDFSGNSWWRNVPNKPGWYFILTNTPLELLSTLVPENGTRHYNIGKRVNNISEVQRIIKIIIEPSTDEHMYVVYNGHHNNLMARAREHTNGDKGTGCLCLNQYTSIHEFQWVFSFVTFEELGIHLQDHEVVRNAVEQAWRYQYGWPAICIR